MQAVQCLRMTLSFGSLASLILPASAMASELLGRAPGWKSPSAEGQNPTVTCRDRSGHGLDHYWFQSGYAGTPTTRKRLRASRGPPSPTAAGAAAAVCTGCLWAGQVRCTCRPSLIPLTGQIRVSGAQSAMASEVPGWAFGWKLRPYRPERAETAPAGADPDSIPFGSRHWPYDRVAVTARRHPSVSALSRRHLSVRHLSSGTRASLS